MCFEKGVQMRLIKCFNFAVFESNGSNRRGDFKRRSYSGEWLNDCFTWREEYQYKLQMGYINEG